MSDYKLYTIAGSCSSGVAVLMEKLGLNYEIVHRKDIENYQQIVPTNKVPAIEHKGKIITEGAAIALYLLENNKNEILPKDPIKRVEFYEWLMFCYATIHPAYAKVMSARRMMDDAVEGKQEYIQKLADQVSDIWQIVNKRLKNSKFIFGDKISHVDYMMTIYTGWGNPAYKINIGDNVRRLANDVSNLPEFKSACKKEENNFKIFYS